MQFIHQYTTFLNAKFLKQKQNTNSCYYGVSLVHKTQGILWLYTKIQNINLIVFLFYKYIYILYFTNNTKIDKQQPPTLND